ncbi:MAG: amidase [Acidimicrobiia bacterium]|nr:amidase [Acidimicrobiia bacterium]
MTDDFSYLDATGQADLVRAGEVTPLELVDAAIARIEAVNPQLNAVITPLYDRARTEAVSHSLPDGPFRGVPFLLKDLSAHSAGDPFHEGMGFLKQRGWTEPHDTTLVARFRAAGLIVVGKTNTPELGILPTTEPLAYGPTHNPWDLSRSTGGSSGGSAAAVAAGLVPLAHANDGGGSIRIPASECGLVGLKPTRGRVSCGPEFGDVMGGLTADLVVSRSVRDTATALDAVQGMAPGDPFSAPDPLRPFLDEVGVPAGALRIGVLTASPGGTVAVHPDCVEATEAVARLLEGLGHRVEPSHPAALDDLDYTGHFITNWAAGAAWNLDYWSRRTGMEIGPEDVEPLTWALADLGRSTTAAAWLSAREWLQANSRAVAAWWSEGHDLLLTPTIAEPPPLLGTFDSPPDNPLHGLFRAAELVPFTPPFNVTGQPAISLPLHWNADGLPIGVQLVAAFGREDLLLRVAAQLEGAHPWAQRIPPIHA